MKFDSIVALRLAPAPSTPNEFANVLGYSNPGDGGYGDFYWDAASTATTVNGIIEQASGGGTGRWKRLVTSEFNVKWFGALGNDIANDTNAFQMAIDYISSKNGGTLFVPSGSYIVKEATLKNGVFIKGAGIDNTYIKCKDAMFVFASPDPEPENEPEKIRYVELSEDVKIGSNVFHIDGEVNPGEFIRLLSKRNCTRKFIPTINQNQYFLDGEMFKVLKSENGIVEVEGRSFYEYLAAEMKVATVFAPSYGGGITDITLTCDEHVTRLAQGLIVRGHESFEIGTLKTMHFNRAGVSITKSYLTAVKYILSRGGVDGPGYNYGLVIEDGSKYTTVERVSGNGNRHTVAGGGTGWAISMYNHINCVTHTNDTQELHGVDTHANTANWSFGSIYSTNGISISGTGHTVNTAMSVGGQCYLAYGGGDKLYFGNIQHLNPERCYNEEGMVDTVVNRLDVVFDNSLHGDPSNPLNDSSMYLGRKSKNLRIHELNYVNNAIDRAIDNANATTIAPVIILYKDNSYGKFFMKGFRYLWLSEDNIRIDELHTVDCGWSGAIPANTGTLYIDTAARQSAFGKIISEANHPNLTFDSPYIQFRNSAGGSNVSVKNAESRGTKQYATAINCPALWTNVSFENINLAGDMDILPANRYLENVKGLADTLPIADQAIFSGNGSNKTFNIPHGQSTAPVYYESQAASAAANGLFYVTANATNIIVEFATAPASGTNNVTLNWSAKFKR